MKKENWECEDCGLVFKYVIERDATPEEIAKNPDIIDEVISLPKTEEEKEESVLYGGTNIWELEPAEHMEIGPDDLCTACRKKVDEFLEEEKKKRKN